MRLNTRFTAFIIAATAVWLLGNGVIGIIAVEGALHPLRNPVTAAEQMHAQRIALEHTATLRNVTIRAADGVALHAWSIRPNSGSTTTVLLLHGQSDNRAGMLGTADLLLRNGYSVLLPDARAHGDSDGALATYGVLERDDLRRWFEWLQQNFHPRCIDGVGDSMGAAQLLQSVERIPGYCAVIAESPFSTFREAAYDRMGQQFGTRAWLGRTLLRPAVESGVLYARLRYGIDLSQASPLHAVVQTHTPVLLIHGLADTNLPPRHSEVMVQKNPSIQLWEPKAAGHCGAASAEPALYERWVINWFAEHQSGR